ncbi:hypothetical protein [Limosilactobacillus reuteri]|uniref:hypothetical protein n=1 Tax=Limosilactobacillus reuteri TaxID=1598 RepID=UPI001C3FF3AE|nr:hypothetical protein [Limosilactobacillus reuteri]
MEADKYLKLIQEELQNLPDYVNEYYLGTNHAVTTTYQYLTEIRRFFDWLRSSGLVAVNSNKDLPIDTLANLRRSDVMLYIDYLQHTTNAQGRLNSPTSINRSISDEYYTIKLSYKKQYFFQKKFILFQKTN